jgi:hypothetical protein
MHAWYTSPIVNTRNMSVIEVDAGDREFNAVSFDAKFMNGDI